MKILRGILQLGACGLLFAPGCRPAGNTFSGDFIFLNKSGENLQNVTVDGFGSSNPPVGLLVKDQEAASLMGRTAFPDSCTITYNFKGQPSRKVVLPLRDIAPEKRQGALRFTFTPRKIWTFEFVPSPYNK